LVKGIATLVEGVDLRLAFLLLVRILGQAIWLMLVSVTPKLIMAVSSRATYFELHTEEKISNML